LLIFAQDKDLLSQHDMQTRKKLGFYDRSRVVAPTTRFMFISLV